MHISREDLKLFQSWDFGDPEVFDLDAMEALCNAKAEKNASLGELGRGIRSAIRGLLSYDFAGVLLLSLLALFVSDRSGGLQGLYALLAVVAVETAMLYHGRGLRERVDVPLMLTAAAVQLTVGIDPEKLKQKQTRWGAAFLAAALILSQVPNLIARKDDAMERYVGASHLHGAYQVIGRLTKDTRARCREKLGIDGQSEGYKTLCAALTFLLVCAAWVLFRADRLHSALAIWKRIALDFQPTRLLDALQAHSLGLDGPDSVVLLLSAGLLYAVDWAQYRGTDPVRWFETRSWPVRELLLAGLILLTFFLGIWGNGFHGSGFIYAQF